LLLVSDIHFDRVDRLQHAGFLRAADEEREGDRVVLIAGDLTMDGTESEYEKARAFVDGLQELGLRIILTPGNHDFGNGLERRVVQPVCRDRYRSLARNLEAWWRAHPEHGTHILSDDGFDSLTRIDNHLFVALRSVHSWSGLQPPNRVRGEQIDWANRQIEHHRKQGDVLHFVTHRSIWELSADKHPAMEKSKRLARELLRPHGFRTYIHGHNHVEIDRVAVLPGTESSIRHLAVTTLSDRVDPPRELSCSGDSRAWTKLSLADLAT
jgi:3',5'-cyclic AMP phosphodiesterase CpdA